MKIKVGLSIAIFMSIAQICLAKEFEGILKYKMNTKKTEMLITYYFKDMKVYMEYELPGKKKLNKTTRTVVDYKAKKAYIIMDERKQYRVQDLNLKEMKQVIEKEREQKGFVKTGRTEKILGYECEEYRSKYLKGEIEIWVTSSLGPLAGFYGLGKDSENSVWEQFLSSKGYLPLRILDTQSSGKESTHLEAIEVTQKNLPAALFEIPKDYQFFDPPQIFNKKELLKKIIGAAAKQ